ncbi:hypothetical protein [Thiolapillus sp.]|uniref:hypothetical protein n=1 Tax=Thiolapillus sp. TaxID=2017437 RepID=UPI003AF5AA8A
MIDFGTSQSPKSTRPLTTYWCPSRPGHPALRVGYHVIIFQKGAILCSEPARY